MITTVNRNRASRFSTPPAGNGSSQGFTLVELLVVISIIVILMALLLPTIGAVRARSRSVQCANNQRQVWLAYTAAVKNRRGGVSTSDWKLEVLPFVSGEEEDIFFCPEDVDLDETSSFGMNHRASRLGPKDPQGIVFLDFKDVTARIVGRSIEQLDAEWPAQYAARHSGQMNVVFHDGSGATRSPDEIDPRYCEYYRKYWWPDRDIGMDLDGCLARPGAGTDTDGDGIPNTEDPDDDGDGIPDEADPDDDNDGIPDNEDPDDDNDGIPDVSDPDHGGGGGGGGPGGGNPAPCQDGSYPTGGQDGYIMISRFGRPAMQISMEPDGLFLRKITDPNQFTDTNHSTRGGSAACQDTVEGDYELWFETRVAIDFNDLRLRVKEYDNGYRQITIVLNDDGGHDSKIYGPDGELLLETSTDPNDLCGNATYLVCP